MCEAHTTEKYINTDLKMSFGIYSKVVRDYLGESNVCVCREQPQL
jgi:hypothetical protein